MLAAKGNMRINIIFFVLGLLLFSGCAASRPPLALDNDARAQSSGSRLTISTLRDTFDQMRRDYDPTAFSKWSERLHRLKPGMSRSEVYELLRPEGTRERALAEAEIGAVTASGQHESLILDEAYYAELTFSFAMTNQLSGAFSRQGFDLLIYSHPSPIGITYRVR